MVESRRSICLGKTKWNWLRNVIKRAEYICTYYDQKGKTETKEEWEKEESIGDWWGKRNERERWKETSKKKREKEEKKSQKEETLKRGKT